MICARLIALRQSRTTIHVLLFLIGDNEAVGVSALHVRNL